jgi:hypothetical protein
VLQCMHLLLPGSPFPEQHGCLHNSSQRRGDGKPRGSSRGSVTRGSRCLLARSMHLGLIPMVGFCQRQVPTRLRLLV